MLNEHWLDDLNSCKNKILDSNFEEFLGYKKLFKLVFDASNNLDLDEYRALLNKIGINSLEAKRYSIAYDKLFNSSITEYKISDELAKKARNWDKSIWIEFSDIYADALSCRKTLFYVLISGKLKYSNICMSIEKIKLNDVKKYKKYIKKFKPNKSKSLYSNFKSIRTRLNNFINKDFKSTIKADSQLMETIKTHHNNLIALIEEYVQQIDDKETFLEPDLTLEDFPKKTEIPTSSQNITETQANISSFLSTEIFKLYQNNEKDKINWGNPYYSVIFLGLDVFNLPSPEEYRKKYKELIILFHPDNKPEHQKETYNLLMTILNDINANIWGICGENYLKFTNSIKFSLTKLGV